MRNSGASRVRKLTLSALVSKDLVLDFSERTIVLILFLYFANKMLPRLAGLIVTEIAHPELLWLAASAKSWRRPFGHFRIARCFPYTNASLCDDRFKVSIRLGFELDSRERAAVSGSGCKKRIHTVRIRYRIDVCGNDHPDFSKNNPLAQLWRRTCKSRD